MRILDTLLKPVVEGVTKSTAKEKTIAAGAATAMGTAASLPLASNIDTSMPSKDPLAPVEPVEISLDNTPEFVGPERVRSMLRDGYDPGQVQDFLKSKGASSEGIYRVMSVAGKAKSEWLESEGYTPEAIYEEFDKYGVGFLAAKLPQDVVDHYAGLDNSDIPRSDEPSPIEFHPQVLSQKAMNQIVSPEQLESLREDPAAVVRAVNQITYRFSTGPIGGRILPDNPTLQAVKEIANEQAGRLLTNAGFENFEIDKWGGITVVDPNTGEWEDYANPWYIDIAHGLQDQVGEITGAIGGAYIGAQVAKTATSLPGGRLLQGGAILTGAALFAGVGRGHDTLRAASKLNEQISTQELIHTMGDAAATDAAFSLGVSSLFMLGKGAKSGIAHAFDRFLTGRKAGAYEAAKDATGLNDAQVVELFEKWEKSTGQSLLSAEAKATGNLTLADKGTALQVMGQTTPGMTPSIQAALNMTRTGGTEVVKRISARAKALDAELAHLTNDNMVTFVKEGLNAYTKQTKAYFNTVKSLGTEAADEAGFRFDYNSVQSLEKYLSRMQKSISDYPVRSDMAVDLENIRRLGGKEALVAFQKEQIAAAAEAGVPRTISPQTVKDAEAALEAYNPHRTLADLIELRKVVNSMSSNTRYSKYFENTQVFKETISGIDKEIARAADMMDDGGTWLSSWKSANTEYSKMLTMQSNVLYKALTNPKVSPDRAVKAFAEALTYDGPETYMNVMATLPPSTRRSVEGAVVKHFTEKSTITMSEGVKAIDFGKLDSDLGKLALTNPAARDVKRMVSDMADLYKNDPDLLQTVWGAPGAAPRNNIATSVKGKMKMQLATLGFQIWQSVAPGAGSRSIALTLQMRRVLDNPLDAKAVEHLKKTLGNDPELETMLHQYAIEFAKFGEKKDYGRAPLYRVAKPGNAGKASNTSIGHGVLTYTDKAKATSIAEELGAKVTTRDVPIKAIAQPGDLEAILGRPPTVEDFLNPEVMDKLRANFMGYTQEDKAILFK